MSKSDPDNAIFMEDSSWDVERKINKAFCIEGVVKNNAVLEFIKFFVFGRKDSFLVKWDQETLIFDKYEDLEEQFSQQLIKAKEIKQGLIE